MQTEVFHNEMARLTKTFGAENFSSEKKKLIWIEVRDLSAEDFQKIVNTCIGEFHVNYPPKVSHFREMAHGIRKEHARQQEAEVLRKCKNPPEGREGDSYRGLQKVLKDMGAHSLMDAIQKKRRENQNGQI